MTGTSDQIDTALATIRDSVARIGEAGDIRSHTRAVASMLSAVRHLGRSASGLPSAKSAILDYLLSHVGQTVTGGELEAVSGISEYARRVRDLRAEGWRIVGGATAPSVRERNAPSRHRARQHGLCAAVGNPQALPRAGRRAPAGGMTDRRMRA
jgi:hypothetical protein